MLAARQAFQAAPEPAQGKEHGQIFRPVELPGHPEGQLRRISAHDEVHRHAHQQQRAIPGPTVRTADRQRRHGICFATFGRSASSPRDTLTVGGVAVLAHLPLAFDAGNCQLHPDNGAQLGVDIAGRCVGDGPRRARPAFMRAGQIRSPGRAVLPHRRKMRAARAHARQGSSRSAPLCRLPPWSRTRTG